MGIQILYVRSFAVRLVGYLENEGEEFFLLARSGMMSDRQ